MKNIKRVLAYICAIAVICMAGSALFTTQAEGIAPEISNVMKLEMELGEFGELSEMEIGDIELPEIPEKPEKPEEPTVTPAPTSTLPEIPEITEAEEPEAKFMVAICIVNAQEMYFVGDIIRIDSMITGECIEPAYQWQVMRAGTEEWVDIEGATGPYYEFAINEQNFADSYRVNVVDLADEAAE